MKRGSLTAIVLAGGSGSRMGADCKKQYMQLGGRPVLYYPLKTFQESCVDDIILVTNEEEYCRKELIQRYNLSKVTSIVAGGEQRYDSVCEGLKAAGGCGYVMIHDGARPFVTGKMIDDSSAAVRQYHACAVGMPVKDTIKIADGQNYAVNTPMRECVWQIQTPQTFAYELICKAYENVFSKQVEGITDDAMVVEYGRYAKVKLIYGSYQNIKITTPEDLLIAEAFLRHGIVK